MEGTASRFEKGTYVEWSDPVDNREMQGTFCSSTEGIATVAVKAYPIYTIYVEESRLREDWLRKWAEEE